MNSHGRNCFDCGVELKDENRSKDTADGHAICGECSETRWRDFMESEERVRTVNK